MMTASCHEGCCHGGCCHEGYRYQWRTGIGLGMNAWGLDREWIESGLGVERTNERKNERKRAGRVDR